MLTRTNNKYEQNLSDTSAEIRIARLSLSTWLRAHREFRHCRRQCTLFTDCPILILSSYPTAQHSSALSKSLKKLKALLSFRTWYLSALIMNCYTDTTYMCWYASIVSGELLNISGKFLKRCPTLSKADVHRGASFKRGLTKPLCAPFLVRHIWPSWSFLLLTAGVERHLMVYILIIIQKPFTPQELWSERPCNGHLSEKRITATYGAHILIKRLNHLRSIGLYLSTLTWHSVITTDTKLTMNGITVIVGINRFGNKII